MKILGPKQAWEWASATSITTKVPGSPSLLLRSLIGFGIGIGVAGAWTAVGLLIAWHQNETSRFISEWENMQAFFCLGLGTFLLFIAKSGSLGERVRAITKTGSEPPRGIEAEWLRAILVAAVSLTGIVVFNMMGFNAEGALLWFMRVMSIYICFLAGLVTLHATDLIVIIHNLQKTEIKTHRYSPAHTAELRDLVSYFTFFSLVLTIAYAFACVGTLRGGWTGNPKLIEAAQLFWPAIYVPACSIALIYPHLVVHTLIRREKENSLASYQRDIDGLLENYENLKDEDVQRINLLSQVFDRFRSTPNYIFDVGIVTRAVIPHLVNVAVFFAKPLLSSAKLLFLF